MGGGFMSANDRHQKVRYFLGLARRMTRPEDRAVFTEMATVWMDRAEQAEEMQQEQEAESS